MRLRIQFEKLGPARFTSHRDVIRLFQRCLASAGIPVTYTEGYHPHMKMSFAPPLKTGWEGCEEYMDLHVDGPPGEIRDTCNARLPEGFRIKRVVALAESTPKIASDVSAATMAVRLRRDDVPAPADAEVLERRIRERFIAGVRGADTGEPRLVDAAVRDAGEHVDIVYTTTMNSGRIVAPPAVLADAVGDPEGFCLPARVSRRAQFVLRNGEFVSPISKGVLLNQS
jgi:radical SAM-linked protein